MPKIVDHDARRKELVHAAWQVISDRGIDELTIREIARQAGYSAGILTHYFDGKDDLLAYALKLSFEEICERYDEKLAAADNSDDLRTVLLDNLPLDEQRDLETRVEVSFWPRSLQNKTLSTIQRNEGARQRDFIKELASEAQTKGKISEEHDLERVVDLLTILIVGIRVHGLLYPERVPPSRQQAIMEYALELLAPRE